MGRATPALLGVHGAVGYTVRDDKVRAVRHQGGIIHALMHAYFPGRAVESADLDEHFYELYDQLEAIHARVGARR